MKKQINRLSVCGLVLATVLVAGGRVQAGSSTVSAALAPDSAEVDVANERSVVDEVVWVVGDEPILRSDIEVTRLQGESDGNDWGDNADCAIPEQLAVQKLFLHQAALDSIEVSEAQVAQGVEQRINYWIQDPRIGSKERLEELQKKSITQIRQDLRDDYRNMLLVQNMQEKLVEDVKVSPAEVRSYFKDVPEDSIPTVPTTVEVEILTQTPRVETEEINRVKEELRNYTDRVTKGETSFATLARLYSEDPGSARQGGELGYMGRGMLDPAFAAVAFNLTDPNKISKIVETEFGYHIIQLIDKRGDKLNCRHILLKPKISAEAIEKAEQRLDSITNDIKEGKLTFEQAASFYSDDKDTKNNNGLMANTKEGEFTSRFRMEDLPTEVARAVSNMKVGELSKPFEMENTRGKTVCAIVKLKSRTDAHKATMAEDFQVLRNVVLGKRKAEVIHQWVVDKIKETYVRMNPRYLDCKFEYEGWIK